MRYFRVAALVAVVVVPVMAQQTGRLCVKTNTGRAGVFLDGKYLGPAENFRVARTYVAPAGEHELRLVDPRYQEATQKVMIAPGKKTTVRRKLTRLPAPQGPFGTLRTQHDDRDAAVFVNGKYVGHVDEFSNGSQGLMLPAGEYQVRIEPRAGAPVDSKVRLEAGKKTLVR